MHVYDIFPIAHKRDYHVILEEGAVYKAGYPADAVIFRNGKVCGKCMVCV